MTLPSSQALQRLRDGNHRFVDGPRQLETSASATRRGALVAGQQPFAVILGCADSRVPPEILFDQGLGDLFVVRVAGNVAAPTQIGSIEYAVEALGTRLILVLGHSGCGAVTATLEAIRQPMALSDGLRALVDRIRPGVEPLIGDPAAPLSDDLVERAIQANIHATVAQLQHDSPSLARHVSDAGLRIVGAEYSLASGAVEFLGPELTPR